MRRERKPEIELKPKLSDFFLREVVVGYFERMGVTFDITLSYTISSVNLRKLPGTFTILIPFN